jgi:hypothetical protein
MIVVDRAPPTNIMAGFDEAGVIVINGQDRQITQV